jgi:hypothetical protein
MAMKNCQGPAIAALALGATLAVAGCGAGGPGAIGTFSGSFSDSMSTTLSLVPTSSVPALTQSTTILVTASLAGSTPVAPSPMHPKRTITNTDIGSTVHIQVGDTIDLALKAANSFQNWEVAVPDATVLKPIANPAAAAARGMTLRTFQAVGAGQTDVTATSKPSCVAGQACPQLVQGFRVTVVVGG